ncbi:MAG: hypothetical protein COB53_04330 [Elusimicrobia bacterium]|nr:MAG: hypothetical protein COB53_04330 [Elusimicrobiota bacterium]
MPGFCDLCGEPFAKKKEAAKPPVKKEPNVKVPADVMAKMLSAGSNEKKSKGTVDIPAEFRNLDTGGQVAKVPEEARKLAWVFLAVIMIWMFIASGWLLMKS